MQTLHIWIVENSSGQVCQQPTWVCVSVKLFLSWTWKEKTQTENRIIYNLEGIILSRATTLLEIFCPINLFQENITKEATTWYYQIFYYYRIILFILYFSYPFFSGIQFPDGWCHRPENLKPNNCLCEDHGELVLKVFRDGFLSLKIISEHVHWWKCFSWKLFWKFWGMFWLAAVISNWQDYLATHNFHKWKTNKTF